MQSADIFSSDKETIDTQKVLFKIWENRQNDAIVTELADILSQFVDEKRVFKDIEYYLPQLAHIIIQLDQLSEKKSLERLAIFICETSIHAALQLSFILVAAIEDYQPEYSNGLKNPKANILLYSRCVRLLQDVERAVIYGSIPERENGTSSPTSERRRLEVANRLSKVTSTRFDGIFNGPLMYKRVKRLSMFRTKPWKDRYFVVDRRVLHCYREPHAMEPVRSILLQNCSVVVCDPSPKYGNTLFEIVNESSNCKYQLRAKDEKERQKWVELLISEINGAPPPVLESSDKEANSSSERPSASREASLSITDSQLSPAQRKRFYYFKQQRIFITNLTNICERLRFQERSLRKHFLQRDMKTLVVPPVVNLPMCGSLDTSSYILRALPSEGHAFTTKARVPCLMLFEMEVHPKALDVASFLGCALDQLDQSEIIQPGMEVTNCSTTDELTEEEQLNHANNEDTIVEKLPSRLHGAANVSPATDSVWKEAGTGMIRLAEHNKASTHHRLHSFDNVVPNEPSIAPAHGQTTDPPPSILGETFAQKAARLRARSPYGHLPGWKLDGLIAKSNDDVRQEVFVMQLIHYYRNVFRDANLPVWLYTYRILSTSKSTGLIQLIPDAISIDGLKKREGFPGSIPAYFAKTYGSDRQSPTFRAAMKAFITSMAGYSIVTYLLAIKDRHNGNVMIDTAGHIIHIDFGFVFGLAPGKAASMEKAPWKLTPELVEVFGGVDSDDFKEYTKQCVDAFTVARKHANDVINMMEIMMFNSNYPAFLYNPNAIRDFKSRLFLNVQDKDIHKVVYRLMARSNGAMGTKLYDDFQLLTNGIAP